MALGVFFGFVASLVVNKWIENSATAYTVLTLTVLLPTIPLLIVAYTIPESWIFLMKKGRYQEALESACLYRKSRILGARDVLSSHLQMLVEDMLMQGRLTRNRAPPPRDSMEMLEQGTRAEFPVANTLPLANRVAGPPSRCRPLGPCVHTYQMEAAHFFRRLDQVFQDDRNRHALYSSAMVMSTQALCGINVFAFFSLAALPDNPFNTSTAAWIAVLFGAVNYLFGLPSFFLSDRFGRVTLLLLGLPVKSILILILGLLFLMDSDNPARTPLVAVVGT